MKKLLVAFIVVAFFAGLALAQGSSNAAGAPGAAKTEAKAAPPEQKAVPTEVKASQPEATKQAPVEKKAAPAEKKVKKAMTKNPTVEIQTNMGNVYLEVFQNETPIHAKNFLDKVKAGKYDGLTFHRIVPGFVIQGGDPTGTGSGSMGPERLADEKSPFPEVRGTVAMARSSEGASNCQFYINLKDNTFLDAQKFSTFAKVTKGMDVVDKIAGVQKDSNDKPLQPVVMTKVQVVGVGGGKETSSKAAPPSTEPKGKETK